MSDRYGFSLRIFLPDGSPDGLRLVEKSNWTGHGIVCPRPLFPTARSREEFSRTGVYVLLGPLGEGELPEIYIGEGDPIRPRLDQHQAKKDFWTTAICFTSKDANLNKAHVQYLEARLVQLATEAKRCTLENGNAPQLPSLSEADIADMEAFLAEILLCVPVLGVTVFEKPIHATLQRSFPAPSPDTTSRIKLEDMIFHIASGSAHATGYESQSGFVVRAQSTAAVADTPGQQNSVRVLRQDLLNLGVLVVDGEVARFTQDYEFNSPSSAASLIVGRSANGRIGWKTADGRTLRAIQEASV